MKDYEVKVLDEKDQLFIETLKNLGISRNVATIVAYLMNVDEKSSHEIEISTGLRQPEVSLAIRLMRNNFMGQCAIGKKAWERATDEYLFPNNSG